jgi:hypothetical protein
VSLTKKPGPTAGAARSTKPAPGPAQPSQPQAGPAAQPPGPLTLNEIEQEAVDRLRAANRSISKRSIAEMVRTELGRSISSDRAAEIARHFRTLRTAA